METTLHQATPVEYELEIEATAEELAPELQEALRKKRAQTDMKGFRKGKVPLALVKKMHGQDIGYGIAERYVQQAFKEQVESDELDVVGQPTLTELDYELDGDMRAVIKFGVRPEVELADLSDEEISKLVVDIDDEDVEEEVEQMRIQNADLLPVEDEAAAEDDYVIADLQRIDASTDTPIIGEKEEDLSFFLDDDRLRDELRAAIIGKTAGATFRVELPEQTPQGEGEMRLYEVTVKDVKRRDLPPFDEALVDEVTDGQFEDPDAFRAEIRRRLEEGWSDRSREMLQSRIVETMLERHPVPVPESLIEAHLDSFVEQVKQRNDGELPDDFDMTYFRQRQRGDAEQQARWMLIRDAVIDQRAIEVSDEDLQAFFEEQAEGDDQITKQQLEQFYNSMPRLMERVKQQILSRKTFDLLASQFDIVEKDREAFEAEMEALHAHAQDHDHDHDHGEEAESAIIT